jgi:2,3,4,5-tetrahydropyridine-2-carboxylate N-succinyltransferase
MTMTALQSRIEALWDRRDQLSPTTTGADRASVEEALEMLDSGKARVAEPDGNGGWKVNQWLKQAVLMSFRLADSAPMEISTGAYDKVPLKAGAKIASAKRASAWCRVRWCAVPLISRAMWC